MSEDQLYDAAEREMDLYRNEITRITAERDELRAKVAAARSALQAAERVAGHHERALYAAWIDVRHGDPGDAVEILAEQLDGYDGPQWNGRETGIEWLERTREAASGTEGAAT